MAAGVLDVLIVGAKPEQNQPLVSFNRAHCTFTEARTFGQDWDGGAPAEGRSNAEVPD